LTQLIKRLINILAGLLLTVILHASDGAISFILDLTPITSRRIFVDSTKLILSGSDAIAELAVITGDTVNHQFDSLAAGYYFLTVQLYQKDYILTESFSKGYLAAAEKRDVNGKVILACAYPILYVNWNPDLNVSGDDFYDFAIDPDSNYLRRYPLPHLDSLAQAFRDSGMHYYQKYPVNWGLLDTNLIPIVEYPWGFHRNPVTTCHTAFAFYDEYVENGDSLSYLGFINNVNWLLENWDSNFYLHYDFEFTHLGVTLPNGWVSGMAQGLALGAVSLAYYKTGERKYLDGAIGLFGTLNTNTGEYYSIGVDEQDYFWLEEYPSTDFCHVFNGYVAALWGLWCYYTISGDEFAAVLLEAGIKTIVDNYPEWNINSQDQSYYCLHYKIDSKYHEKHKVQLRTYGDYFQVKEMHQGANCFENRYFAAYPRSLTLPSDTSLSEITLFTSLTWDVASDKDWLTLTRKGTALEVSCSENPFAYSRTARIYFSESDTNDLQTILISQEGVNQLPTNNIDSIYVSADSGLLRINIKHDTGWFVTSKTQWILTSKENDSVFTLKYEENPSFEQRTGFVEVRLIDSVLLYDIRLLQDSLHPFLYIKPDSVWIKSDSGKFEISVVANHQWDITYDSTWIDAIKINDTLLLVKYLENTDYLQSRITNLTLYLPDSMAVNELKIVQGSRPLYLNVDPVSLFVNADSGFTIIDVQAPVSWTAKTSENWLLPFPSDDSILYVIYLTNASHNQRTGIIYISLNDTLGRNITFFQLAGTVGINTTQGSSNFEIYPNPAISKIHFRLAVHETEMLAVEIFNLSGEKVMDRRISSTGNHAEMDIHTLGNGIYFVKVTSSNGSCIRKLVIEAVN
jgi:hypothetical protein